MIHYSSADAGAHVLTNANSSLAGLLRKVLVGTAGIAWGSKASAGWTEPFATASNVSVFRQGSGSNQRYLRMVDNGAAPTGTRRASFRGYEAMTAISTGTNAFPTAAQLSGNGTYLPYLRDSGGGVWSSSNYRIWADSKCFLLFVDSYGPNNYWEPFFFGDFISYKAGDTFNTVIMGGGLDNTTPWQMYIQSSPTSYNEAGCWCARSDTGAAGSKQVAWAKSIPCAAASYVGSGDSTNFPYPDRIAGGILMAKPDLWVDNYRRGKLPMLWDNAHTAAQLGLTSLAAPTSFSGAGALAGKTFEIYGGMSPTYIGAAFPIVETSDTWYS